MDLNSCYKSVREYDYLCYDCPVKHGLNIGGTKIFRNHRAQRSQTLPSKALYYEGGLGVVPQKLDTSLHTELWHSRINSLRVYHGLVLVGVCISSDVLNCHFVLFWITLTMESFLAHNNQEDFYPWVLEFCMFTSFGAACAVIIHIIRHFIFCILMTFLMKYTVYLSSSHVKNKCST